MKPRTIVIAAAVLIAAGCAGAYLPTMPAAARETKFPPEQIARGAELAAIGDCAVCHTTRDGASFAGGRPIPTPFGSVYSTNITPDDQTGIGLWSEAAFRRAMRDGIARDGRHLYPVLPYPHFTKATDADIAALYAFFMTRQPVHQTAPENHLAFPMDERPLLAVWNLLYLNLGEWHPDSAHDATWNRGSYLVEAIGHCGACHTPHNALGAEKASEALTGGDAERWYAPPLAANSPAREPWTAQSLATYLKTGFQSGHSAAAGPMTAVTEELSKVPQADIDAIAVYLASRMPKTAPAPHEHANIAAGPIFQGACGGCHYPNGPNPPLSDSTALNASRPDDAIQILLLGIPWREGKSTPYMPGFAAMLTDQQIADLVTHLHQGTAAWTVTPETVAALRRGS